MRVRSIFFSRGIRFFPIIPLNSIGPQEVTLFDFLVEIIIFQRNLRPRMHEKRFLIDESLRVYTDSRRTEY